MAAASGPEADAFTVKGMTMRVESPKYIALVAQRDSMRADARERRRSRDEAQRYYRELYGQTAIGLLIDDANRRRMAAARQDVARVRDADRSYVRKPPSIAAQRNTLYRGIFLRTLADDARVRAAIDALDAEEDVRIAELIRRLQETPEGDAAEQLAAEIDTAEQTQAARLQSVVDAVKQRFEFAIRTTDFSEIAVTRGELRTLFFGHLRDRLDANRRANDRRAQPVPDEETTRAIEYRAATTYANVVPAMSTRWLEQWFANADGVVAVDDRYTPLDAATLAAQRVPLSNEQERASIIEYTQRLTGTIDLDGRMPAANEDIEETAAAARFARIEARQRDATLMSVDSVRQVLVDAFVAALRTRAAVDRFGRAPESLTSAQRRQLATGASDLDWATTIYEEALQVERVRTVLEASSVIVHESARVAALEYAVEVFSERYFDVPLYIEAPALHPNRVVLAAELVPVPGAPDPAPQVDDPTAVYRVEWLHRRGGPFDVEQVVAVDEAPRLVDGGLRTTYRLPAVDPAAPEGLRWYDGPSAGVYRVRITRARAGGEPSTFVSGEGTVALTAECVRCRDARQFFVGGGALRQFGECEWRAYPLDRRHSDRRTLDAELAPYAQVMGITSDIELQYDDSIVRDDGSLIDDDESLLTLAGGGTGAVAAASLRRRFFEYSAIAERASANFERHWRAALGDAISSRLFALLRTRPAAARRTATPFVGAIIVFFDPLSDAEVATFVGAIQALPAVDATPAQRAALRERVLPALREHEFDTNDAVASWCNDRELYRSADVRERLLASSDVRTVPLGALLTAVTAPRFSLAAAVTEESLSHARYFSSLVAKFSRFVELYRAVSLANGATSAAFQFRASEFAERITGRKRRGLSLIDERTCAVDRQVAMLSGHEVEISEVWDARERFGISLSAERMLVDLDGAERLRRRIDTATARTAFEIDRRRRFDDDDGNGEPRALIASQSAHRLADWRGVHSAVDKQPDMYRLSFAVADGAVVDWQRGSERLGAGYAFGAMHERIGALVSRYSSLAAAAAAASVEAAAERLALRDRIKKYVLYFNVLAQFAPTTTAVHPSSADDVQRHLASLDAALDNAFTPVLVK